MNAELPFIALTPGHGTGIGPEQVARILHDRRLAGHHRLWQTSQSRDIIGYRLRSRKFPISEP